MRIPFFLAVAILIFTVMAPLSEAYPDLQYYVTDESNILFDHEIYDIETLCVEVDTATGAEIAVLIVDTTYPDPIDIYAVQTFDESDIGQKDKDNGLLMVIAVDDRTWRIEVGYGLEGVLPDIKVDEIARGYLVPYLDDGLYYEAILYTVAELGWIIVESYEDDPPEDDDGPWYPIPFIPLKWWQLIIAFAVTFFVMLITGGRIFLWIGGSFGRSGGGFGGGRSGGGGASGKW